MGELFGFLFLLVLAGISWLIFGNEENKLTDNNRGEVVPVDDLIGIGFPLQGRCHVQLVRQSGNPYRDLGVFPTTQEAIKEVVKSFRRGKIETVRVTHSDISTLAIYRQVYDFTGRAEGKKLAGAIFQQVECSQQSNLDLLKLKLRQIEPSSDVVSSVFFDYECGRCGSTNIETEDEDPIDDSEVFCRDCGVVFCSFFELQIQARSRAESAVASRFTSAND